jgi:DNA-directed RNA polymerase specialized sigma24 family protein
MSPATLRRYRAERLLERDFKTLRSAVLATVGARLRAAGPALDRAELDACYAIAWQGLYAAALAGEEILNPRAWLVLVTYRRAIEELRARRSGEEPLPASAGAEPDLAGELDDRDRLRNLIQGMRARLDLREREAAALCYLHGCSRGEAARRMGVSDTRMRKLMEGSKGRAGVSAKVGELVETIRGGDFCEQQASLMRAFAFGLLDPEGERHRLAVMHRRDCPACRRYIVSLRGAAALLPPVLTLPGAGSLTGLAGLGHQLAAAPGSASMPSLGASAATGGGASAGGSWALGAGLGAKLAAGCLLVAGIGAGCVAIEHGAKGGPRSPAAAPVRPSVPSGRALARPAASSPVAPASAGAGRTSRVRPARPPLPGSPEFSLERQSAGERSLRAPLARAAAARPAETGPPPTATRRGSPEAALREFSPG